MLDIAGVVCSYSGSCGGNGVLVGEPMNSRDDLWLVLACIGIAALWEAVSWAYGLSDEQAGWLALAVTCVSTFVFIAWKEWRSK